MKTTFRWMVIGWASAFAAVSAAPAQERSAARPSVWTGTRAGGAAVASNRQVTVRRLTAGLAAGEPGNSTTAGALIELGPALKAGDFSDSDRQTIARRFAADPNKQSILLAGLADVPEARAEIDRLAREPIAEPDAGRFYGTPAWAAALVKARAGDPAQVRRLLSTAGQADLHVQATVLLTDLAYTARPEAVDYARLLLFSDARLSPVKSTVPGARVAAFAARALARMLNGFPVSYKEDHSYSDDEIERCRTWMAAQTGWSFRRDNE